MDGAVTFEGVAASGFGELMKIAPIVTVLLLVIFCLCWFVKSLLQDARDERKLNRDALVSNTAVIAELKELIRGAINR